MTNENEKNVRFDFDDWWEAEGIDIEPPALKQAFREIALKGWLAAGEQSFQIAGYWGASSAPVIKSNILNVTK